jgi:predicted transcriptional regulator
MTNLAPMSTIAAELGVGAKALRRIVDRAYRAGNVALAYTKTAEGALYDVDAVKVAAFPHLPDLRIQRMQHEREETAKAKVAAAAKPHTTALPTPSRRVHVPEVIVLRRRPATTEVR